MHISKNFKDLKIFTLIPTLASRCRDHETEMPSSKSGHLHDTHFSQGSGIMWKRWQRLHKLETVDDYNDLVFYGHSREILHMNS